MTRAAAILDVLAEDGGVALGPSELARRLGLPKSSIANICGALADVGLVRRVGTGLRPRPPAGGARRRLPRRGRHGPGVLRRGPRLPVGSEETVQLAILDGLEMTYLARHDGRQPVRLTSQIGRRLPATSTATGKAALASLDPRELDRRLAGRRRCRRRRANAIRTVDALLADLDAVRDRGYAIDDEETMEGVVCFGIAIPGRHPGEGPNAASITLLKVRATDERVPLLVADLHSLADAARRPAPSPRHAGGAPA